MEHIDKIVKFELFKVPPRWLFLKVETEQGLVGWGEPNLEGFSDTVAAATKEMMESLIGEDPDRIQFIWQKLCKCHFYGGNGPVLMSAVAGIDQALWDIKGKRLSVPVHSLLGGAVREKMLAYRWCGGDENSPEETAKEAKSVIANSNFKNLKMNACPRMGYVDTEGAIEMAALRMAAVREAVGPDIGIALDFHGRCKLPMAKKLIRALEPYNPLFLEEPLTPDFNKNLIHLQNFTPIPIACGERMFNAAQFRDLFNYQGCSIIQPDLSHAGGISHVLDIARMAEHHDIAIAPHCPLGPIALSASLQVDFCSLNAVFQESSIGIHYNQEGGMDLLDYLQNPEVFDIDQEGYFSLPKLPGLGIIIDEAKVREAAKDGHKWKDRIWLLKDGAPTKW